jgi:hypothetical protein
MHEALIRYQEERHNATSFSTQYRASSESDILEYLAFSTYQKGEIQSAIRLTQDLLRVDPAHPRATGNIVHYERMIDEKKQGEDGDNGVSDRVTLTSFNVLLNYYELSSVSHSSHFLHVLRPSHLLVLLLNYFLST